MSEKEEIKTGRPSEYKEEYIEKAKLYLRECSDTIMQGGKIKVLLPTIEGFACYISVAKSSLYEWGKEHKEFSNALEEIKQEQHRRLLNKGLSGDYNSTIAKLILSSNHNYKEKSDVTSDDEKIDAGVVVLPAKEE